MKRVALAVALLIGLATPSQADYQAGQAAYRLGDFGRRDRFSGQRWQGVIHDTGGSGRYGPLSLHP